MRTRALAYLFTTILQCTFANMYKPGNKYIRHTVYLRYVMDQHIRRECHTLGISMQTFIRSLATDYFLRKYGKDVNTNEDHGKPVK